MLAGSRLNDTSLVVLAAIARGCRYGFDVMDETGLKSGPVYRALSRLDERGLVSSRWEAAAIALKERRPRRRYYEITERGRDELSVARARLTDFVEKLAETPRRS